MLLLTSTSDLITLITSAAASIDVHSSWVDNLAGAITPGRTNTATIASATTTTIVGSPAASTQRNVKFIMIRNRHASTSCDITVKHTDGTNNLELYKCVTLGPGQEIEYVDGIGFNLFQTTGSITSSAVSTYDPTNVAITGGTIAGTKLTAKAGTTGVSGLAMASGSILSTPVGGTIEYDGLSGYFTNSANERGVIMADEFISIFNTVHTLTSQTAVQPMFNSPANGQLNNGVDGLYQFECFFDLASMSASSGSFGFGFGGSQATNYIKWWSIGNKTATPATAAAPQCTFNLNSLANTTLVTASTSTTGWCYIRGEVRLSSGAGTVVPQISLGVAAAATVGRESFFRMWRQGVNGVVSVGNWT